MDNLNNKVYFKTEEDKHIEAERWVNLILPYLPQNREFDICDLYDNLPFDVTEKNKLKQVHCELTALLVKTNQYKFSRPEKSRYHIETTNVYIPYKLNNENYNITIITAQIKDKVLLWLCNNCAVEKHVQISANTITNFLEIEYDILIPILKQFKKIGLIGNLNINFDQIILTLSVESHDLLNRFGFFAIEELFKANLDKIGTELDNLKKDTTSEKQIENIAKISTILNTLISGLQLFQSK